MTSEPPRAAVWLVELFAPIESAEGVLGDLEEEFAGRLTRSGHRASRRWYWRHALRTTVHLVWGAGRAAPWSTTAQVLASFVVASLLYGVMSVWIARLVSSLPIYDYNASVWSWRAAAVVRFVVVPLALGWSIAFVARGREMVITTLVASLLVAILFWNLTIIAHNLVSRFGLTFTLVHTPRVVLEILQKGTTYPLGLVIGGMLCRLQRVRAGRIAA